VIEAASGSTYCLGRWRAAAASTVDGKAGQPYHELDPSVSGHRSSARAALPMLPQLLLAGWSMMGPHPRARRRWIRQLGPSRSSTRNGGHACCQSCSRGTDAEWWPPWRDVVACASVCRRWRDTTVLVMRLPLECAHGGGDDWCGW
jgi:hypothetical protein